MRLQTLGRLLLGYCVSLHPTPHGEVIASIWQGGELSQRVVLASQGARDDQIDRALSQGAGELVLETVVQEGALLRVPELAFAMALVPARDGLRATLDGKTVYVTPDDLLSRHVYDHGFTIAFIHLSLGSDVAKIVTLLSERLAATS